MSNISYADIDGSASFGTAKTQGSQRDVPIVFFYGKAQKPSIEFVSKLTENILDINVNYSLSAATAITFSVIDPGLEITKRNYFQPGQPFIYRSNNASKLRNLGGYAQIALEDYVGYVMEIADVNIEQSQGNSPIIRIQGYTRAIQQMKRDRKPGVIKGSNHQFVINAATKYGLKAVVQPTSKDKSITSGDGEKQSDSLWDVLTRLASESKDENKNPYIIFESDGVLYFGTQQWLLFKWGHDSYQHTEYNKKLAKNITTTRYVTYLHFPPRKINGVPDNRFILNKMPNMHKAENDPMNGDGSCVVERLNGTRLRPGMTVNVGDVPWFTDNFLITSVDFQEMVPDPVAISFATPPIQETKIKQIEVGTIYPGSIEWATVEGIAAVNPGSNYKAKTPGRNVTAVGGFTIE